MSPAFSVVAIIAAFNEGDIIEHVVRNLIEQGVNVYLLDDGSTDDTVAVVDQYVGRGVIGIEHLADPLDPATAGKFQWERILLRKAELARELDANWFIHHDADEFRESPWPHDSLKEAIRRVDALGFNAIDFAAVHFWPVHDRFRAGADVRDAFTFWAPPGPYDRLQIRSWKAGPLVDLASSGGHEVCFPNRNVFPVRFILRHYPIRGQAHGERKIFQERRRRFIERERDRGWHVHYDDLHEGTSFIRDSSTLTPYDPERLRLELMLNHRGVEELERSLHASHSEVERLREEACIRSTALQQAQVERSALKAEAARLKEQCERQERELADIGAELRGRTAEAQGLRLDFDGRAGELWHVQRALEHRTREVQELRDSRSWRVTRPLRAMYGLLSGARSVPSKTNEDVRRPTNRIEWGDLARLSPVSAVWGIERGMPIDRYYIDGFLRRHRADIRGRVLEVKNPDYANTFGGQFLDVEVLDINASNRRATLVADLTNADQIAGDQFDCFILTQTLHIIYDLRSALRQAVRLLKPGGVLLCTIPAVSRVNYEDGGLHSGDFWRLTSAAVERLFLEAFHSEHVRIETYGNVRVCTAFLYGLATEDLDVNALEFNDPWFPLIHCIRAVKQ